MERRLERFSRGMSLMSATLATTASVTIPAPLEAKFKRRVGKLQMLPEAASKALKLGKDPHCTIEDFTSIVGQDAKLAADILKIANSVLYSPRSPIVTLHRAVVRLGFQECQNLILSSSIASMVNRISMEQEWIRTVLWWHSLNTGLLATFLNRSFQMGFNGEEFTAGIIHDIGRTLIAVVCPEQFAEIDPLSFEESVETLHHETNLLGADHCRIGAWFASLNRIPDPIPEVILRHHQPEKATEHQKLTALIAVADHMANYLQKNGDAKGYEPRQNPHLTLLSGFLKPPFETHFAEIAVSLMHDAQRDAKSLLDL